MSENSGAPQVPAPLEPTAESKAAWTVYAERAPETAGVYEWRVPSRACQGLVIRFFAHMRKRGAGYHDVLSPSFDHWDGYRVHVPAGTQWRTSADAPSIKEYQDRLSCLEGVEVDACPFCGKVPTWNAVEGSASGGVVITSEPYRYNRWWLECCGWAKTPHHNDPRSLAAARRALLAKAAEASVSPSSEAASTPEAPQ